jgi:hypothetical protein
MVPGPRKNEGGLNWRRTKNEKSNHMGEDL